jgi:hypothetical protein
MKNFIKKILGITALEQENQLLWEALEAERDALKAEVNMHRAYVRERMAELKEYTRVDADIGYRGNNTIILSGVFRNKAFVRFYEMGDGEFKALVDQIQAMKDHALIRNVDWPPELRGAFKL